MNDYNISVLKSQIASLGFEDFEHELYSNVCFMTNHFVIHRRLNINNDVINFYLHFEKIIGQNGYVFQHYDAMLRKVIDIPHSTINNIDIEELEKRMKSIDWKIDYSNEAFNQKSVGDEDWSKEKEIEQIVTKLTSLASSPLGKDISNKLKIKYWTDNPPQHFIENFSSLKAQFEIVQRFYLFDQQPGITIEEAYRYLNNRWMEKKLFLKKKTTDTEQEQKVREEKQNDSGNEKTSRIKKKRNKKIL